MNPIEIILLSIGTVAACAGIVTLFRAKQSLKDLSVKRFDDL
ncbi:MAG: hypothetical protein R3A50_15995 [Saprospiraceae bacterium]